MWVGVLEKLSTASHAFFSEVWEKPDGACGNEFVLVGEELFESREGFLAHCFEGLEAKVSCVDGRRLEGGDGAVCFGQVEFRDLGGEAFGGDAEDGA